MNLYKMFMEKVLHCRNQPLILLIKATYLPSTVKLTSTTTVFSVWDIQALRDIAEEEPLEVEASEHDLAYIKLDGNVACG